MMLWWKIAAILAISSPLCRGFLYLTNNDIPELEYLNKSVDPCENFYEFACGNFENIVSKPQEVPLWDHFLILQQNLHQLMKDILESKNGLKDPTSIRKARAAYRACLSVDYSDKLNLPELAILEDTGSWPLITDSPYRNGDFSWNTVGELTAAYGVPLLFYVEVKPNLFDTSQNVIYINKDPVSYPSIYRHFEDNHMASFNTTSLTEVNKTQAYETFLGRIALQLRDSTGSHKNKELILKEVVEIVKFMGLIQKGGIEDENHKGTYNLTTVEQLQDWTDTTIGTDININWLEYLNRIFSKSGVEVTKTTTVMISDKSVFYGVLNLINQTSADMLKNFVISRLFTYTSADSNGALRDAYQQFRVDMKDIVYSRSDYCVRKVLDFPDNVGLSMALTYEYQRYHFDKNKIQIAAEMIADLTAAFVDLVNDSDWLDDETRTNALRKVDKMITLLAYPNFVEEPDLVDKYYENVRVCAWDHFGNSQRLRAFGMASNLALLGKPPNKEVWPMSPLEVNAYYNAQNNRILFPVSMLNPVFYTGKISALDYGRIGVVIGHEITHGFDNQGMYYDEDGNIGPAWWTPETNAEYQKRSTCFKEQYSKYLIQEINEYVDSTKTLRENIADNGGLREAFRAFQKLKNRKSPIETVEEYTPEQLFFIGFGTMWCSQQTVEYLNATLASNYPPSKYRVIGAVSNNQEFSDTFNCPIGSNMNPEEKCILW